MNNFLNARVAELVDALDSKSSGSNIMRVRLPSLAPKFCEMASKSWKVNCIIKIQLHKLKGVFFNANNKC